MKTNKNISLISKEELYEIVVCIPIHGPSTTLNETINRLNEMFKDNINEILLVISNSGEHINNISWQGPIKIINLSSNVYWTGAVKAIFSYVESIDSKYVLLLNHDCKPAQNAIKILKDTLEKHDNKTICHAVLIRLDNNAIAWWAGNIRRRWNIQYSKKYYDIDVCCLPSKPFQTLSTMGQCLLLPHAAVKAKYLNEKKTPHYWGDSAMTSNMRRDGYKLLMVPDAHAYTDQSDYKKKLERITCRRINDIKKVYFNKSSNRYLPGAFRGMLAQHDNLLFGLFAGLIYASGKIIKGLSEMVKWKFHR